MDNTSWHFCAQATPLIAFLNGMEVGAMLCKFNSHVLRHSTKIYTFFTFMVYANHKKFYYKIFMYVCLHVPVYTYVWGLVHAILLTDYKRQPALRALCSPATGSTDILSDASLQFQNLKQDLVDLLVQCPDALTQLKQCLTSLVLPLGDGKVASLVDPSSYGTASTIPEFFRLMAPYWNCLSTNLLSLLLEASGCKPATAKLAEFEEARTSSAPLVLCTQRASTSELSSVHRLPFEQLQSLHPAVFTESVASEKAEQNTARITATVSKPLLQVSCYEKTTTAICGFFRLPKAALVYAGCSENPLALCWLVSRNLLSYMRNPTGTLSGYHLLAEQQITHIAFGEVEFHNCLNLKVYMYVSLISEYCR